MTADIDILPQAAPPHQILPRVFSARHRQSLDPVEADSSHALRPAGGNPVHHVELTWDPAADAAVREQWQALVEAGLPSQAAHTSTSNAPHTTVSIVETWPGAAALATAWVTLPLPARLGPLTCFGRGPFVLVRAVVATPELLALHRRVHARLGDPVQRFLAPGAWVPHVTLAHRLSAAQVAAAVDLLGSAPPVSGALRGARHWDSAERRLEVLAPGGP